MCHQRQKVDWRTVSVFQGVKKKTTHTHTMSDKVSQVRRQQTGRSTIQCDITMFAQSLLLQLEMEHQLSWPMTDCLCPDQRDLSPSASRPTSIYPCKRKMSNATFDATGCRCCCCCWRLVMRKPDPISTVRECRCVPVPIAADWLLSAASRMIELSKACEWPFNGGSRWLMVCTLRSHCLNLKKCWGSQFYVERIVERPHLFSDFKVTTNVSYFEQWKW